jgi:hypothetical protein
MGLNELEAFVSYHEDEGSGQCYAFGAFSWSMATTCVKYVEGSESWPIILPSATVNLLM